MEKKPTFDGVRFFCAPSLLPDEREALHRLLTSNGAEAASLQEATHIITNTPDFDGRQDANEKALCATVRFAMIFHFLADRFTQVQWVERSILSSKSLSYVPSHVSVVLLNNGYSPVYYSPNPEMLFSGVVACATDVSTLHV